MAFLLRWSHAFLLATAVLLIGVCSSLAAFYAARQSDRQRMEADFRLAAHGVTWAFEREAIMAIDLLNATAGLYAASDVVGEEEFQTFVEPLMRSRQSILAVEWAPRISKSDRAEFEAAGRAEGCLDFTIKQRDRAGNLVPAESREEYFPIAFLSPEKGNELAPGFDLASTEPRRLVLDDARDSGQIRSTARVALSFNPGTFGSILTLPVYEQGASFSTVDDRRAALRGFIVGVIRTGGLLEQALARSSSNGINVYSFDLGPERKEEFLYEYSGAERAMRFSELSEPLENLAAGFHVRTSVEVGGRPRLLIFTPTADYVAARQTWRP
jgi:CHASE1-domain containing sensor protein